MEKEVRDTIEMFRAVMSGEATVTRRKPRRRWQRERTATPAELEDERQRWIRATAKAKGRGYAS